MNSVMLSAKSKNDALGAVLIVIVLILTAVTAYPQSAISGRVVEVLDGKTFVIEVSNARITGVLKCIEVPESDQPLSVEVKQHLSALVLNKTAEFKPLGLSMQRTIGKLTVNGIDVGQQMLRDGAAWHDPDQKNGQIPTERALYEQNEQQAKSDKRGVWGISDLKPAWEFRAEKERAEEERKKQEYERAALNAASKAKTVKAPIRQVSATVQDYADFQAWSDIRSIDREAGIGGIIRKYDTARGYGYNLTTQAQVDVAGKSKPSYMDFRLGYVYAYSGTAKRDVWAIAVLSDADEYKFAKSNNLTILADGEKIEIGKAYRFYGDTGAARRETLVYAVTRSKIEKIAKATDIKIRVGVFSGDLGRKLKDLAKNLLNSAN